MTTTRQINDHPFAFTETVASTEDYRRINPQFTYESPPRPVWLMQCAFDACQPRNQAIYRIIPDRRQADRQLWRLVVPHSNNHITQTPSTPFDSFEDAAAAAANHHMARCEQQPPADDGYRQFRTEAYQFLGLITT